MERRPVFFWLMPENDAARNVVNDPKNAHLRDVLDMKMASTAQQGTYITASSTSTRDPLHQVAGLRVIIDPNRRSKSSLRLPNWPWLFRLGSRSTADVFLGKGYSPVDFFLAPDTLNLVCSRHPRATLVFEDHCGDIGSWVASGFRVIVQTVLPSSRPILFINESNSSDPTFSFRWSTQETAILRAKKDSMARVLLYAQHYRQNSIYNLYGSLKPDGRYPLQLEYETGMKLVDLLRLPADLRYMIFKVLLPHEPLDYFGNVRRRKHTQKKRTLDGCVYLLQITHQLLNPQYSCVEIAAEFASIFYRHTEFLVDFVQLPYFLWTIAHMPPLGSFDPCSRISRLFLEMSADLLKVTWPALGDACSALREGLTSVTRVEIHIYRPRKRFLNLPRAGSMSILFASHPWHPPVDILRSMRPIIRELRRRPGAEVKVMLLTYRKGQPRRKDFQTPGVGVEDITQWWDGEREADKVKASEVNRRWVESMRWSTNKREEDWKRKGVIEAAVMRRLL